MFFMSSSFLIEILNLSIRNLCSSMLNHIENNLVFCLLFSLSSLLQYQERRVRRGKVQVNKSECSAFYDYFLFPNHYHFTSSWLTCHSWPLLLLCSANWIISALLHKSWSHKHSRDLTWRGRSQILKFVSDKSFFRFWFLML